MINREIPAHIIDENDQFIAFLDIMPLVAGHTLVVPKKEIDHFFHLAPEDLSSINLFAKRIAVAIEKTFHCNRVGLSVIGLEVPHAHMHLVPLNSTDDLNFSRPKLKLTHDELAEIAIKIKAHL